MLRMIAAVVFAAVFFHAVPVLAAQRTFVASNGVDTHPCTLAQPCRGLAAAILLTDADGEVVVLDSAGYGPVTITKAVSIIAPSGVYAGISVLAGQDGVTVNAGATDKIALRGLSINGQGGNRGIVVNSGQQVHIEHCEISNLGSEGILVNGGSAVYVANTTVRSNGGNGLAVTGTAGMVFVNDSRFARNLGRGILAEAGSLSLNRSILEKNGNFGLEVNPATAAPVSAFVRSSVAVDNASVGIFANADALGEFANISVDDSAATRNIYSGFAAGSAALGQATFVLSQSSSTDNFVDGMSTVGSNATVSVSASTMARNGSAGFFQGLGSVFRSHGNNASNGNTGGPAVGTIDAVGTM